MSHRGETGGGSRLEAVIAAGWQVDEETRDQAPGPSEEGKGPSSEEEPNSVLDRAIDAFCTNRPLQSDEMAALAASGEVTQDEIYETGYRWRFAANAWAISPEAVGRKLVPSRRYRGPPAGSIASEGLDQSFPLCFVIHRRVMAAQDDVERRFREGEAHFALGAPALVHES